MNCCNPLLKYIQIFGRHSAHGRLLYMDSHCRLSSHHRQFGPFIDHVEKNGYLKFWLNVFGEIVSVGGGLIALQSLLIIRKGTSRFNSNWMNLFRNFYDNRWPSQNFYQMCFGRIRSVCLRGRGIQPPITLKPIKGTKNSDYQSNEHPSKFIRSPFLYRPYIPPGHSLQPLPWGL